MPCRSTIPPVSGKSAGWTCTGEDLVVLMTAPHLGRAVPVVCPRAHLGEVMRDPWAGELYDPRPYAVEGDHMHIVLGGGRDG